MPFAAVAENSQTADFSYRILNRWQTRCVGEYLTPLSEKKWVSKACAVTRPLQLVSTEQSYPNLKPSLHHIQIWAGTVSKTISVQHRYLRELIDECRGKIISSREIARRDQTESYFEVENPNLDPMIDESYLISPMADDEAKRALATAQSKCESETALDR